MTFFRALTLPFWSIVIAIVLWVQVHGQGVGSVRMDVSLQVRDVPADMVIVNDLPDQVSITVKGLQAQLNSLDAKDLFVSVDASTLNMPGVIEQALDVDAIDLPVGLRVEKIQPDSVQLQVDHIVTRAIDVAPIFDLPQGWEVSHVVATPGNVKLSGPEVWISTLNQAETIAVRLDLNEGLFDVNATLTPLSGQGIHLLKKDLVIRIRGELNKVEPESIESQSSQLEPEPSKTKVVEPEAVNLKSIEATTLKAQDNNMKQTVDEQPTKVGNQ